MKSCRNKKTRVLMDWVSGVEQWVSNNKMYLELNGFHHENGVLKYNNIDKYELKSRMNDCMKYNQHRLK